MPRITLIGQDGPRMLMSSDYRILLPHEDETPDRWRDRLGFTIHIQSMGSLTWYGDSQAELNKEGRNTFVRKYSKEMSDHDSYVKVSNKPKYLLVFKHPAPYDSNVEAVFADSYTELAAYRSNFMPLVNYIELCGISRQLSNVEERLERFSDSLRNVAANLSDLVVKDLNRKAVVKQPRTRKKGGRRG